MTIDLKIYGTFELTASGPKFLPDDKDFFRVCAEGLVGKRVQIDMSETRRSNPQNAFYWSCIVGTFLKYWNDNKTFERVVDVAFVHDILKSKFLGWTEQVLPGGEIVRMPKSSARLTVSEFSDYVTYCQEWGESFFEIKFPEKPKGDDTSR